MKRTLILAGSCCALFLATAAHAAEKRGFYVDVGLGFGRAHYGGQLDDLLDAVDDNGYSRLTLALDLSMGGAVLPNLYVVGSVAAFGDRLTNSDDTGDYLQLNTYLFGPGVRYYPLPSHKHLMLGVDVGLTKVVLQSDDDSYEASDSGSGLRLLVAYDIDRTLRGPTLQVGAQFMTASVEDVKFRGLSVFAKFAFK